MFKKNNNLEYLVGNKEISNLSLPPFETLICNFLGELSKKLDSDKSAKKYPDIKALAFWCRKQKILNYKVLVSPEKKHFKKIEKKHKISLGGYKHFQYFLSSKKLISPEKFFSIKKIVVSNFI